MVALLVVLTIVACLTVDMIVLSVRKKRAEQRKLALEPNLVFAQDGGKSVKEDKKEVSNTKKDEK
ncbi:hypothetical protein [Thermotomaculum hydrothermale]|uniref:hypothetical protein n=1 Tax=Thermotomaculum hydrothermale TaxID=981385 RepID=UPI0019165992|nr:hypothetical protein [Thermotomaculum hydrothermale]